LYQQKLGRPEKGKENHVCRAWELGMSAGPRGKPAWAAFDAEWYRQQYASELIEVDPTPAATEAFYYAYGTKLKHSPNVYFDERWYLANSPDVAEAVEDGRFASGFEHYGLTGHKYRSPHWLFCEPLYVARYQDISADLMKDRGYANGYDHYLQVGDPEFRSGHWLFDPIFHRDAALSNSTSKWGEGAEFSRFLRGDRRAGSEVRLSWYFDPLWYISAYPIVSEEITAGLWSCALEHYLCNFTPMAFNPNAHFSEQYYYDTYPDIHPLLSSGKIRNGFEHFLRYGAIERRSPRQGIDLQAYFRTASVQTEIAQGLFRDAFAHFESSGGKIVEPSSVSSVSEDESRRLYRAICQSMVPALIHRPLDFRYTDPEVSVIVLAINEFALTLATLASLRANFAGQMQVIFVDNGSKDDVSRIEQYATGLDLVRYSYNRGFVEGCNAGLRLAKAQATLFLNNDVQLGPGAISNALQRLGASADTGAVGAKIVRTNGRLQEAGCIIWRDGWTSGYLRDEDPNIPEANFVRVVDFCSAAFLLCKTSLLNQLEGFDLDYSPAYFEEADLCVRLRNLGYMTVYDPSVTLVHYEYGSGSSETFARIIGKNQPIFRRKSAEFLRRKSFNKPSLLTAARSASSGQRRILFIEDRLPFRHLGSGFTRSHDIIRTMASLGHQVTIYPIYRSIETISEIYSSFPDTVEVIFDRELPDLEQFLTSRSGYYDLIWIARTHNAERLVPPFERCAPHIPTMRVVLDTEAVASMRTLEKARVLGKKDFSDLSIESMVRDELSHAFLSQRIVAVNDIDAVLLHRSGFSDIEILGHMQVACPTPKAWSSRSGILFLASILDEESPNFDALSWFSSKVLPILDARLPPDVVFAVAGNFAGRIDLSPLRQNARVRVLGKITDLRDVYGEYRVFVAPTRFAAGIPYKIHEAAAHGIPIVASDLLCRQIGWQAGQDIISASIEDAEEFANAVIELYTNEDAWMSVRLNALRKIQEENSPELYRDQIAGILSRVLS
jgi:GT2 family glycosyltransferase